MLLLLDTVDIWLSISLYDCVLRLIGPCSGGSIRSRLWEKCESSVNLRGGKRFDDELAYIECVGRSTGC